MQSVISPIVSPSVLLSLKDSTETIIIDARVGANAKEKYASAHLAGAFFVDLNTEMADIRAQPADGGRHPLPDTGKFSLVLQKLGITQNSHVIIYDDKNGSNAAARFWWMLRAAGIKNTQVLDGGFDAAVKAGFPVNNYKEVPALQSSYTISNWILPLADMYEVEAAVKKETAIVIDVRSKERFDGETEPFDRIAGHIPGAVNIPFESNLDEQGNFLPSAELSKKYTEALSGKDKKDIIIHCGSGVTACHTILALDHAGIEIPKLYVGSWSEWCNNNKPIATKK